MTMRDVNFRDAKIRRLARAGHGKLTNPKQARAVPALPFTKCRNVPKGGQMALAVEHPAFHVN
jgi:hypothetical protein